MKQYIDLVSHILADGTYRNDRTGIGTKSVFAYHMKFDLSEGFPILTTKKIYFKAVVFELIWSLRGYTNIKFLNDNGIHIWDNWAEDNGELGPIYGKQWRAWSNGIINIDQISNIINQINNDPYSRRIIVNSWNVAEIDNMAIPPCPLLFQYYVSDNKLSCCIYQRSADVFIGLPFDISVYALLTSLIANICKLATGELVFFIADAHIYNNHLTLIQDQIKRKPFALPKILFKRNIENIDSFCYEDVELINYVSHPKIKGDLAI